jgi:hypothetical protein
MAWAGTTSCYILLKRFCLNSVLQILYQTYSGDFSSHPALQKKKKNVDGREIKNLLTVREMIHDVKFAYN